MTQAKQNIARWVLQGICVLGILSGLMCGWAAVAMFVGILREDSENWWLELGFVLAFSAVLLVIGAWLTRDCYRMLRRRSFEGIRSISVIVALLSTGLVDRWLMDPRAEGESRVVHDLAGLAALLFVVLVYFGCKKLLNRLREAAYGSAEPCDTPDPAG